MLDTRSCWKGNKSPCTTWVQADSTPTDKNGSHLGPLTAVQMFCLRSLKICCRESCNKMLCCDKLQLQQQKACGLYPVLCWTQKGEVSSRERRHPNLTHKSSLFLAKQALDSKVSSFLKAEDHGTKTAPVPSRPVPRTARPQEGSSGPRAILHHQPLTWQANQTFKIVILYHKKKINRLIHCWFCTVLFWCSSMPDLPLSHTCLWSWEKKKTLRNLKLIFLSALPRGRGLSDSSFAFISWKNKTVFHTNIFIWAAVTVLHPQTPSAAPVTSLLVFPSHSACVTVSERCTNACYLLSVIAVYYATAN